MTAHPTDIDRSDETDHRRLGRDLHLFASAQLAGAGLPLWLPEGAVIREQLEQFVVDIEGDAGYRRVYTPVLGKRQLYERSGHWRHFSEDMFPPMDVGGDQLVLRPSLCPHHMLIYAGRHRSFRDLPLRLSELGAQFRMERSGVLGGLSRVRAMTLNDGHVFASADAVASEVGAILALIRNAYAALGVDRYRLRLSLRGPHGDYVDKPVMWDHAEQGLRALLAASGAAWDEAPDEAAFYGPKIDVQVDDARGREQTLSTVQIDFHMPEAFDLSYQDGSGGRQHPVMIHRSLISTMERLVAFLIERYAGAFPVWLAPVQLAVLPVGDSHMSAATGLAADARDHGLRVDVMPPPASLSARIRRAQERKVPFIGIIGDREMAGGTVALRRRDGVRLPPMAIAEVVERVAVIAAQRSRGLDL